MAERWLNQALKSMDTVEDGREKWQLAILREKGEALFYLDKHRQSLAANLKVLYLDKTISDKQMYDLNLQIASSYVELGRKNEAQAIYRKMLKKFNKEEHKQEIERRIRSLIK